MDYNSLKPIDKRNIWIILRGNNLEDSIEWACQFFKVDSTDKLPPKIYAFLKMRAHKEQPSWYDDHNYTDGNAELLAKNI